MAQRTGLEPVTPGVTGRYSNQLNYRCTCNTLKIKYGHKLWWALTGSNRRHSACKADALPTELSALNNLWWALTGSNRRHSACKADALPTELSALNVFIVCEVHYRESLTGVKRFSTTFQKNANE